MEPICRGPWYCVLYVSLDTDPKKQTELRITPYPDLTEHLLNMKRRRKKRRKKDDDNATGGGWVRILQVGDFDRWRDTLGFFNLWHAHTRGVPKRAVRGMQLFERYAEKYSLDLWRPHETKEEIMSGTMQNQPLAPSAPAHSLNRCDPRIRDISDMHQRRKRLKKQG